MSRKLLSIVGLTAILLSMIVVGPAAAEELPPPDPASPTAEVTTAPEEVMPPADPTETPPPEPEATPVPDDSTVSLPSLVIESLSLAATPPPATSLKVTKNVHTEFHTTWRWQIDKTADVASLMLSPGQTHTVNYAVAVSGTPLDGGWTMSGQIGIGNFTSTQATIESVTDEADGVVASVSCQVGGNGVGIPFHLPAGWTAVCEYHASLPDGSNRTNVATVTTSGPVPGGSASAAVTFGSPSSETDECIEVTDSLAGALGTVCGGSQTFTYSQPVGPFSVCGDYTVDNVATFRTIDSGTSGSDEWSVKITVPCAGGCSLTPGYWKTHSSYGPAPYDDTWALLGENTTFFSSATSYHRALWTSPRGNAYWILAHAYIAAKLNQLNGADFTAAQAAFNSATALFSNPAYTPAYIGGLKGSSSLRQSFIGYATILDNYNNGLIGPGHCSE